MTEALDTFRAEVRAWLEGHVAEFGAAARVGLSETEDLALGRRWQALKAQHGFAGATLPKAYGGGGRTALEGAIFKEEETKLGFPAEYFGISLGMPIPILLAYAPEETRQKYAPQAIRGETIWCQLFSEPSGGSDLAGLRLRAEKDGDDWVLNGQKLWTSWAQYSDYGLIIARTDPTVLKHKGLTAFWVDMKAPGVTVRPVRLADGHAHVNEVFFDNVRIADSQRLGEVGGGFAVAIHTLTIERYTGSDEDGFGTPLSLFIELAKKPGPDGRPAIEDGRTRRRLATAFRQQKALAAVRTRTYMALAEGAEPGSEGSIHKLVAMRARQTLSAAALDLMGPAGAVLDPQATNRSDFAQSWLNVPTGRIAGGADEMLLNTIAERVLGLPQDYRPDKNVPFDQIKPTR
ncbi:MAG: acyl-CoA dehydrogenase family protein [Caulobacteraceae bacterium]|nr:acyl-CoA dehydrogenase family protein [Caulobacteraceae bacterium]